MKQLLLLSLGIAALYSCKKASPAVEQQKFETETITYNLNGISTYHGIPKYASVQVFQAAYNALTNAYGARLASIQNMYPQPDSIPDTVMATAGWTVWTYGNEPLLDFEQQYQFSSYRKVSDSLYRQWLSTQGNTLDTASYPHRMRVGAVQQSLINRDGAFIIGSNLYVMCERAGNIITLKCPAVDTNLDIIDSIRNNLTFIGIDNFFTKLLQFREHIEITNYDRVPYEPNICRTNKSNYTWLSVDDKTRYTSELGTYYDFLKTSYTHECKAQARIRIFSVRIWVPAITKLKAGMQIYNYNTSATQGCTGKTGTYVDYTTFYGDRIFRQNNHWGVQKTVFKAIIDLSTYPTEGYWGLSRVKNMDVQNLTGLRW